MAKYITICLFCTIANCATAQNFSVALSEGHMKKLNALNSGKKRLIRYYKYYKKDSAQFVRKQDRYFKSTFDSTFRANRKQEKLRKQLEKKGISFPNDQLSKADTPKKQLRRWYAVMKDSTSSDSLKQIAKQKIKNLAIERAKQHPGFQNLLEQYQISGDTADWKTITAQVPGMDTLSGVFNSSPKELFSVAEEHSTKQIEQYAGKLLGKEFSEADKLKGLPDQYKKEYEQYMNREKLKSEGKEKVIQDATNHFAEDAKKLQSAQATMSKLMSKYREFSNSNDLSDAVKHTSMKGKTFFEHLLIGGNFNVVSTEPFSIDFSPMVGYKFTTKLAAGIGMNFRYTYVDSIKNKFYVSPANTSYKAFVNYDVIKGFFAYGEWEKSGIKMNSNDKSNKTWKDNYFIGVGKKFLIHPKLYLTTTALYNLNNEDNNPVHPRRFQMRIGFQVSELATRKKRIYYDPNR
jgi:hypothetical protein